MIRLTRIGHDSSKARVYSDSEIDVIVAYIESIDKLVWLGPSNFSGKTCATIRYEKAKNGQLKGCVWIEDCEW